MDGVIWLLGFVLCVLCSIAGIIGNGMTICIFILINKFRNPIGLHVLGLTIFDFIASSIIIPLKASFFFYEAHWKLGKFMCYLDKFFAYGASSISIMFITSIAFNRWIKMNWSAQTYNKIFTKRTSLMIVICIPVLGYLPVVLGFFGITSKFDAMRFYK
ncbi:proteinase-activated receptor 2-like [Neocloeon triangulifer]|uniref:proteinase-activated receptor 2-like n=1 Tax=Neocloeon triangulifer TaxID=2078957 RepID=UPI00286F6F4E|nr:proteinase-activated receptor 2-like [Neocloeon triangulifer]